MATISNDVPAPSPEDPAQGSWRLTLDKPPPLGLKLLLFVPVNSTLLSGLLPTVQKTGPPTPIALDAAVGPQKIIVSSVVGSPLEVDAPLDLITNKKQTHSYGAPLDLSNKLTPFVPAVSVETPAVCIETPADSVETPAVSIETPAVSVETPAVSIETPAVSIETPAVEIPTHAVRIETPAVSIETPAVEIPTHAVRIEMEAVSIETPLVNIKSPALHTKSCAASNETPAVSIKTKALKPAVKAPAGSIHLATKECWVVLRKWSGKTYDIMEEREREFRC